MEERHDWGLEVTEITVPPTPASQPQQQCLQRPQDCGPSGQAAHQGHRSGGAPPPFPYVSGLVAQLLWSVFPSLSVTSGSESFCRITEVLSTAQHCTGTRGSVEFIHHACQAWDRKAHKRATLPVL